MKVTEFGELPAITGKKMNGNLTTLTGFGITIPVGVNGELPMPENIEIKILLQELENGSTQAHIRIIDKDTNDGVQYKCAGVDTLVEMFKVWDIKRLVLK